ncbi:MAG: indole-3-glycerol phosphate synthase TrpC [Winogradskyella sp.]|nr:indole-3-glycerol phosphate synthase TrpC [Winogradskyella sp.]MBT8376856.1 indole-3-glycerol phosphate synthase TrpC [Bacteroidia bacterium]NNC46069.1 indole-3-glycerol phosphate synthase TrpC [Winogradskyella sp.]NNF85620.1 indole-3-glycerol phosphate synthase TrpC [Winogradskyella sp.]NNK39550.1 indole-3-glycerol phosphate synthase TrpC [Winogradskyella sp.]
MTILDKIVKDKRKEVELKKAIISRLQLEKMPLFNKVTISLVGKLNTSKSGIIAEHKRRSPSKSEINQNLNVYDVASGYEAAGACGMSVLTDAKYFGGSLDDLVLARASCNIPLLRKEFIIDEYQIIEAKAHGADVILLIAAILKKKEIKRFSELAKSLNLQVLLEVHNEQELQQSLMPSIDMLGVNNRDLKTFNVSIETSKSLSALIPNDFIKISESGISSTEVIKDLKAFGYKGFLIGENFMKTNNPGESASQFIKQLES